MPRTNLYLKITLNILLEVIYRSHHSESYDFQYLYCFIESYKLYDLLLLRAYDPFTLLRSLHMRLASQFSIQHRTAIRLWKAAEISVPHIET